MALRQLLTRKTLSVARIAGSARSMNTEVIWPAKIDRPDTPVELAALAEVEKGSWVDLSREDKIALYRAQFPVSMSESMNPESDGGAFIFAICAALSTSLCLFVLMKTWCSPTLPQTITPEWRAAQKEKILLYRGNPIDGVSSK